MEPDGFSDKLLFMLTEHPCYWIQFRQYSESGVWFYIDANPKLQYLLSELSTENWVDQIGCNNLRKTKKVSEFWITEYGLAHLTLLGACDFTQVNLSTVSATPVKVAP